MLYRLIMQVELYFLLIQRKCKVVLIHLVILIQIFKNSKLHSYKTAVKRIFNFHGKNGQNNNKRHTNNKSGCGQGGPFLLLHPVQIILDKITKLKVFSSLHQLYFEIALSQMHELMHLQGITHLVRTQNFPKN